MFPLRHHLLGQRLKVNMKSLVVTLLLRLSAVQASKLYMGCWADAPDLQAFDDDPLITLSGNDNYRTCADYCRTNAYQFSALSRGNKCRCTNGHDWTLYGRRADKHCDDECPDGSPRCGGYFRNAVYASELYYVGCVKDDHYDRIFSTLLWKASDNNIFFCIRQCTDRGHYWAGLQNGDECWCGGKDDIDKATLPENDATDDECNTPCTGALFDNCGGYLRMSIWHILEFRD